MKPLTMLEPSYLILKDVLNVNNEIKPFWIEKITENLPKDTNMKQLKTK
jgi:hypothetical protein